MGWSSTLVGGERVSPTGATDSASTRRLRGCTLPVAVYWEKTWLNPAALGCAVGYLGLDLFVRLYAFGSIYDLRLVLRFQSFFFVANESSRMRSIAVWGLTGTQRLCSQTVDQMQQGQRRMAIQNAGAAVAHYGADGRPDVGLVAVHRALCAGGLALPKGALVKTHLSVLQEPSTIGAEPVPVLVVLFAVEAYHRLDGSLLLIDPSLGKEHADSVSMVSGLRV